jgi:hypothetical protein
MLSQDEVLHNSPMLRSSKPFVPRDKRKLVSLFSAIWLLPVFFKLRTCLTNKNEL